MKTTQAERDAERKSFNRDKLVSVGGGFYSRLLDDADLCACLAARAGPTAEQRALMGRVIETLKKPVPLTQPEWLATLIAYDAALSPPAAVEKE